MPLYLEDISYTPEANLGQGSANHLIGCIQQKITAVIKLRNETNCIISSDEEVLFAPVGRFITGGWIVDDANLNRFENFFVGDAINVANVDSSVNGDYIILEKLDNNTIRVDDNSLSSHTGTTGIIYNKFRASAVAYDFGFAENGDALRITSRIDGATQRYYRNSVPGSFASMQKLGSLTWQFLNEAAEVREVSWDSQLSIQIIEVRASFYIRPFYLVSQFFEITSQPPLPPDYLRFLDTLKHTFRIRAFRDEQDPNAFQEISVDNIQGSVGWFDETLNGGLAEYTKGAVTGLPLALSTASQTVTVKINSVNNRFVNEGEALSKLVLNIFVLPEVSSDYETNGQTATYNYVFDRAALIVDAAAVDGDNEGTELQAIKNASATYNANNEVTVSFDIELASEIITRLTNRQLQPYYLISIYTANEQANFDNTDATNVLVELNQFTEQPPDIIDVDFAFVRSGHNNISNAQTGLEVVRPLQELVAVMDVNIDKDFAHQLNRFEFEIYVEDSSNNEVILQTNSFDLSGNPVQNSARFVNLLQPTPLNAAATEIRANYKIERVTANDTSTDRAYRVQVPFQLRFEEWINLIAANPAFGIDPSKPNNGINHDWNRWANLSGVDFKLRLKTQIANFQYSNNYELIDTFDGFGVDGNNFDNAVIKIVEVGTNTDIGHVPTNRDFDVLFEVETQLATFKTCDLYGWIEEQGTYSNLNSTKRENNRPGFFATTVDTTYTSPNFTARATVDHRQLPQASKLTFYASIESRPIAGINIGAAVKQDFDVFASPIESEPGADLGVNPFVKCCYIQEVYASTSSIDNLKNDKTLLFATMAGSRSSVNVDLEKFENGSWVKKETNLTTGDFGTKYGLFSRKNMKYGAYYLNWRKVLTEHGSGTYRINFVNVSISESYCLKNYSDTDVNGTVRFEAELNTILGGLDSREQLDLVDLQLPIQVRIRNSYFGYPKMNHEIEKQRFRNGFERDFKNELKEIFNLEIRSIPYSILKYYSVTVFQANNIKVWDYNNENPAQINGQEVVLAGGIEPNYEGAGANQSVIIAFEDRYNNRIKRYF